MLKVELSVKIKSQEVQMKGSRFTETLQRGVFADCHGFSC